ncbi:bifunctional hemolysin/adenylate cyclase [Microcystis aeruginosa NIES-2522]|uniref:Calx-beta domain-containing protein n=1 Tax=Microcystis aeruginosa TaxID=1126 RepID=UPI0012314342|nr:Calx-beta domain-containing protein [Microcystis aeruginosa]GCA85153.1 bifunctional hemolysin/adenylate cyclase [Microcystis aeruginosa NIES-2522]
MYDFFPRSTLLDYFTNDAGNDTINGGSGTDRYEVDYSSASSGLTMTYNTTTGSGTITVGTETDTFTSIESFGGFNGTEYNDVIFGGTASEYDYGGLAGGGGNDTISGNAGSDYIYGEDGNDVLNGGADNDQLYGGSGNDSLNGDAGNDYFTNDAGNDTINGGSEIDHYKADYSSASSGLTMTYNTATGSGTITVGAETDSFTSIESFGGFKGTEYNDVIFGGTVSEQLFNGFGYGQLEGGGGNDTISGNAGDDQIYGEDGNDVLNGGDGKDSLFGGNGNDVLNGDLGNDKFTNDAGNDTINGGAGSDIYEADYSYASSGLTMTYDTATASGTITVGTETDTFTSIESFGQTSPFKGTEYNDVIFGGIEGDRLSGGRGNDTISGNAGNDEIYGDDGNDVLNGGAGYDDLRGGNGNDTLQGTNSGIGESDALRGGTENDLFILGDTTRVFYDDGFSTTGGTSDYAIIYDFNPTDDTIQLRGSSSDYLLTVSSSITNLYINKPGTEPDELIAYITDQTALSLTASYFSYVSSPTLPSITLAVSPASVTEDGTANLIYTFTRTGSTTSALTANYTVGGTATFSTDYTQTGAASFTSTTGTVNFLANSPTATVTVDPTADTTVESNETVILTLAAGTGYTVGTTTAVTGTITNVPATSVTPIEAFGNTKLVQDATNKLYAQIGNNNPTVIKNGATHITTNTYPGWQILAAETVNGINQVLLRNTSQNLLYIWNLDSNWNWQSSTGGWGLNSTQAFNQETNFKQDFNGDGFIGQPFTPIETFGNTKLVQDTTNKLYTQIGNNNPTVIKNGATHITTNTYPGWQILAAETVNGINQVLLRNTSQNLLYIWNLDNNWNWQSSTGGWGLNSTQAFSQETNFQQDFNGDGIIGQPFTTLPSITLTVSPASVTEDGTANLIYTFTRTGSTTSALTVNYSISGTATNGTDYASIPTSVTFAANSATATVIVDPTADTTIESNETVALTLTAGTGYTVGTTTPVTGTITNDDFSQLSINNITVVEGLDNNAILTVTVDNPNSQPISFNYTTAPIDATANVDYTSQTGTLIIPANASTATITIPILNDDLNEADEVFTVTLSNPVNATINPEGGIGEVIITDTWQSSLTRTLPNNVENLRLIGTNNINGTGNAGNNNITGNSGNNQINGANGADTLTGGLGADTFVFQFGQSTIAASDQITDFAINSDKIDLLTQGGIAMNAPSNFSRAADSTVTTLQNLINQVFTDANGATTGNQELAVNSAALVQGTTGAIAGTYLVINDSTAGFQSSNDLLINITGFTGALPALGNINVSSFFI